MSTETEMTYDSVHEDDACGHRWRAHGSTGPSQGCWTAKCRCRAARPAGVPDDLPPPLILTLYALADELEAEWGSNPSGRNAMSSSEGGEWLLKTYVVRRLRDAAIRADVPEIPLP